MRNSILFLITFTFVGHSAAAVNPAITGEAEKTAYKTGAAFGENKSGTAGAPVFSVKMQGENALIQQEPLGQRGVKSAFDEKDPRPTREDLLKGSQKKEKKKDRTWLWILLGILLLIIGAVIGYYLSKRGDDDNNGGGGGGKDDCDNGHGHGNGHGNGHNNHGNGNGNGHNTHH